MFPGIYYKSAILLFFSVHGLILSMILLRQVILYKTQQASWLLLLNILGVFYLVPWMMGHFGWYGMDGYREFLFFFPFHQYYFIGPVLYFYVSSVTGNLHNISKKWLHFLPGTLYLFYVLVMFIYDFLIADTFYFYADGKDKDLSFPYQISGLISISIYLILAVRDYGNYRKSIIQQVSYADEIRFKWIRQFLITLFILVGIRIVFFLLLPEWGNFGEKWWFYFFFGIIFYFIGWQGYLLVIKTSFLPDQPVSQKISPTPNTLTEEEIQKWMVSIKDVIEKEELYRNPKLTLDLIATRLNTSRQLISQAINTGFKMNFNDYINQHRISAFKEAVLEDHQKTYSLLGHAMNCGFNSKSTFNRVFKKHEDISPQQFVNHTSPK